MHPIIKLYKGLDFKHISKKVSTWIIHINVIVSINLIILYVMHIVILNGLELPRFHVYQVEKVYVQLVYT